MRKFNKVLKQKWSFHGNWKEKPITVSYWMLNKESKNKNYEEFNNLVVDFIYLDGNYFIPRKQEQQLFKDVKNKIKTELSYFDRLFKITEISLSKYNKLEFIEKNNKGLLSFLERNKDLFFFWNAFSQFNKALTNYFENESKKYKDINYLDYIQISKETILSKEGKEFYRLYLLYKEKDKNFNIHLEDYLDKYRFVGTHIFTGIPQSKKSVMRKLKTYSSKKKTIREAKKDDFFREHKEVLDIASRIACYRMIIVETFDKISFMFWKSLNRLAKKYNMSFKDIINYTFYEIEELMADGVKVDKKIIKQIQKIFGFIRDDYKLVILSERKIEDSLKEISGKIFKKGKIKGKIAFPGTVKGKAKVILETKEISKLDKDDILVAFETTPDYVIAMDKASAIITEQGGITSHAAIVARELEKPCIVGIKNITKILNDNDYIEVDANKGIVRKIK